MYFPQISKDLEMPAFIDGEIKKIKLSDFKGKKNVVLIFYPLDFTSVCPTEINAISDVYLEFDKKDSTILFISKDSVYSHKAWASTSRDKNGIEGCKFPLVSDTGARLSDSIGLYDEEFDMTKRATVILDKELNMYYYCLHHDKIGRCVDEILRITDAMDHVIKYGDTCAMNWRKRKD